MQLDQKALELLDEGLEILTNLTDSIARHGNYSPESTCTFIDQAASSFREAKGILQAVQPVPVVTDEPEFQTAPDNGTVNEVLAYVLDCARRWEPKARIIGNARAGDIARALTATASAEPVVDEGTYEEGYDEGLRDAQGHAVEVTRAVARWLDNHLGVGNWYDQAEEGFTADDVIQGLFEAVRDPADPLPAQGGKADD